MGLDPKDLPQAFRRCMTSETRKQLGTPTTSDVVQKQQKIAEKEMHRQFEQWLNLKGVPYCHSRMDRASTIQVGWPDFTLCRNGIVILIEFKAEGGSLSEDQVAVIGRLRDNGNDVLVTTSVAEAITYSCERLKV